MFDLAQFYNTLDSYYSQHDNAGAEEFMKKSQKDALDFVVNKAQVKCACEGGDTVGQTEANMEYVAVTNELACFYRGLSEFDKSLENFNLAQQELLNTGNQNTQEYGTVLLNKAGTYRYMNQLDNALDCFEAAAFVFDNLESADPAVLSGLANNMGLVYLDKKDPDKAIEHFNHALEIDLQDERIRDKAGMAYNNLATAYMMKGDLDMAKENIDKAIEGLEREPGESINPHYPAALNTRATIEFHQGDAEAALADFKKALEGTEVCYGQNVEYASGCNNIAFVLTKLGRADEAAEYSQKAEEINKKLGIA
ncbi:MAG: tetratricopeptide repeat protein [Eubacteriales bacterium]|nr:tetratricopeptide repeat protein [Eubacteriales bacterium]